MTSRTDATTGAHSEGADAGQVESIVALQPSLSAEEALKRVHLELLRRIEANQEGVRRALDGEYLHDFRVAVRRTRTGLRQLKRVYARHPGARFADDFQWLSKTTSTARDLEVYRHALDGLQEPLGGATDAALSPFKAFLAGHERDERRRCRDAIESPRYATLRRDWRAFLQLPAGAADAGPDARRPVREVAAQRIVAAYDRVVRRSTGLQRDTPAARFHRLRLDCKKLRYLLEFFGALFDGDEGGRAIAALRQTQDSLGAINDLRVQQRWLARYDAPSAATRALAAHLTQQESRERLQFLERFAAFTDEGTAAALRRFVRVEPATR